MVPFLFVFSPSLLLQGNDAVALVVDVATAIGGVWLVSAAMIGYLINLLSWPMRALAMLTGILLLIPQELTTGAGWTDLAGAVLAVALIAIDYTALRKRRAAVAG